ncbi:MAG: hypothetical protein ABR503_11120 [Chitinophagaceae bacterium]
MDETDIPPMPNAGIYKWKIATANDSAQFYFNQGINMYYGFHIIEALASFKKAAKFDADNALIWWAQALAYGPNINDVGYTAAADALVAVQNATRLSANSSAIEKALISAMSKRYSADSTQTREKLNQDYVDAMAALYKQFPNQPDVSALYADALMLQHPWDLWNTNGTPKSWTPLIRSVLEKLLRQTPNHPGANHYYIHVMEPSPFAAYALPSADRLGRLTPGLSHMVHMPSHIYLRTGQYNKGIAINETAVKRYIEYSSLFPAVQQNAFLYQWHNQHMQVNSALMAGRYAYAIEWALELQKNLDTSMLSLPAPMGPAVQYIYMTPVLINIHFSKWDVLLEMKKPADHHVYANIIYHLGKGMSYAASNKISNAKTELQSLQNLIADTSLTLPFGPFSPPAEGAKVASELLQGFISVKKNNLQEAISHFSKASSTEEKMVYNEPRDWLLNPKQYLGAAYLKARQWANAENTFKKDLNQNAQNVWSLFGLHQALTVQNKKIEANIIRRQLEIATEKSDVKLTRLFF